MEEKLKIQLNLELTRKELNHFFGIVFGASLVLFVNAEGASVAYEQIVKQIEDFFIKEKPENKDLLDAVKKMIADGHKNAEND